MTESVRPPKVFISYSWDNPQHCQWAEEFARRLRSDGIEVILDVWEVGPGDHLPKFTEKAVSDSDFVLFICTPNYKTRSDSREGGVGWEGHIITGELYKQNNNRKFIPILRQGKSREKSIPRWALGKIYIDLQGNPYKEDNYKKLLETLHDKRSSPPPIGSSPYSNKEKQTIKPPEQKKLSLSVAFPKLLSKKFSSKFLVHFYFRLKHLSIQKTLEQELGKGNVAEYIYSSDLFPGKKIKVNLSCPDIDFTAPIIRTLLNATTQFLFLGKPKDNCDLNTHQVLLAITDAETNEELQSLFFSVKVVDLVFGYISRPLLSNIVTLILGIGSLGMFVLTFVGQIDKTLGLTSGTTVGIIASIIYTKFVGLYQSPRKDVFRTIEKL